MFVVLNIDSRDVLYFTFYVNTEGGSFRLLCVIELKMQNAARNMEYIELQFFKKDEGI